MKKILVWVLILALFLVGTFETNWPILSLLVPQFILGIALTLQFRNNAVFVIVGVICVFTDLFGNLPVGNSMVILSITGLIVALLSRPLGFFRQQPFWTGRLVWLILAIIAQQSLLVGINSPDKILFMVQVLLVNLAGLVISTWLFTILNTRDEKTIIIN